MKFGFRFGLLAAVAALSLAPVLNSSAQAACTMAAADCTTLATANANLAKETSFQVDVEFKLSLSGKLNLDTQSTGTGEFAVSPAANLGDLAAVLSGVQFKLDLNNTTGTANTAAGTTNFVVAYGAAYLKTTGDWQGTNVAEILKAAQAKLGSQLNDPKFMKAVESIQNIKGFTEAKTTNTPTLDGQNMTEFTDTVLLSSLLKSPDFGTMLKPVLAGVTTSVPFLSGPLTNLLSGRALPLLSLLVDDSKITITRWVGQTDNEYHAFGVDINVNVKEGPLGKPTTGTIHLLVKMTKIGEAVSVTPPAGAKMIAIPGIPNSGVAPTVPTSVATAAPSAAPTTAPTTAATAVATTAPTALATTAATAAK